MKYENFKKGKSGYYIIDVCDKCGEPSSPVQKYKKEYLCVSCLEITKRAEAGRIKTKQEDAYTNRFAELISLPRK